MYVFSQLRSLLVNTMSYLTNIVDNTALLAFLKLLDQLEFVRKSYSFLSTLILLRKRSRW
jgi:hypothetical protein